jgi:hypothetical protein
VKRNDNIATHGEPRINIVRFRKEPLYTSTPQGTGTQLGIIVNFVRNTFKTTMVWQQRQHTTVRFENKRIEDTVSQAQGAQTA